MVTQDKVASALVQISLLRRGHSDDPANNVRPKWYTAMCVSGLLEDPDTVTANDAFSIQAL